MPAKTIVELNDSKIIWFHKTKHKKLMFAVLNKNIKNLFNVSNNLFAQEVSECISAKLSLVFDKEYSVYYVNSSFALNGYGPFIYDVAMHHCSSLGYGISPDRYWVSKEAMNLWKYYYTKRNNELIIDDLHEECQVSSYKNKELEFMNKQYKAKQPNISLYQPIVVNETSNFYDSLTKNMLLLF